MISLTTVDDLIENKELLNVSKVMTKLGLPIRC